MAVGGGVAVAFKSGITQFAEFDKVLTITGNKAEASKEELSNLTKTVKQLAQETTKTPLEIANVANSLVTAGFSATETAQALNGVVKASEATGESLDVVGNVIANAINQFGLAATDSTRVADVLAKVANTSNVSVSGLGESLKFVGTAAQQSNQTLEDVSAVLGLLGDAGLQGGQGGRNLAQALTRLNIASADLPPELKVLQKCVKLLNFCKSVHAILIIN